MNEVSEKATDFVQELGDAVERLADNVLRDLGHAGRVANAPRAARP